MNQDSSFPPILPPSTELGALIFALLPCLKEAYRPFASFTYHMTELSRLKRIPASPPLSGVSSVDTLISDKDMLLHSLSYYGKLFHMPLLSTIANLLQAIQFYKTYQEILPGLFSAMGDTGNSDKTSSPLESMAGLFSGLGGAGGSLANLFSNLGGLSPDLLSSLFSGFSGSSSACSGASPDKCDEGTHESPSPCTGDSSEALSPCTEDSMETFSPTPDSSQGTSDVPDEEPVKVYTETDTNPADAARRDSSDDLYNSLYAFLTPEQKKIYEQLMHNE